ncbi:MFS transporter [Chitinasiproducens palmae]|nr:MFS transporter [Chitinasiproducens palmae]
MATDAAPPSPSVDAAAIAPAGDAAPTANAGRGAASPPAGGTAGGDGGSRARLPPSTFLLALCQAINLTAAVLSVAVAPQAGMRLAPDPALATVPYGAQFAAVALMTYPAAVLMRVLGRRRGFVLGAALLAAAGLAGYAATTHASFTGLVVAHCLLGAYIAFANFYRFAALDGLPSALRPRALSFVVAGGVAAAFTGPLLSIGIGEVSGYAPDALCYAVLVPLALLTLGLLARWRPVPSAAPASPAGAPSADNADMRGNATLIALAIGAAASAYLLMNLLMVQATLVLGADCGAPHAAAFALQGHVLAMFVPSFFTGRLIARCGLRSVLCAGFALIGAAAWLGSGSLGFGAIAAALLLLGVGWNLGYVGGGALLGRFADTPAWHRLQGTNEAIIAVAATIGAFAPGLLQNTLGWQRTNLACLAVAALTCALAAYVLRAPRSNSARASS